MVKYTIFRTKWGYFGLAGSKSSLLRTYLPVPNYRKIKYQILKDFPTAQFDKFFLRALAEQIKAYFEGKTVDFCNDIPIELGGLSTFTKSVLKACRGIKFGQAISYSELAKRAGRPAAIRAVGGVLAKNPLPLIIPCHRVICSNGKIGGFSAAGGITLKKQLLNHEKR